MTRRILWITLFVLITWAIGTAWTRWRLSRWETTTSASMAAGTNLAAAELAGWAGRIDELRKLVVGMTQELPAPPTAALIQSTLRASPLGPTVLCVGHVDIGGRWLQPPVRVEAIGRASRDSVARGVLAGLACPDRVAERAQMLDPNDGEIVVVRASALAPRKDGTRAAVSIASRLDDGLRPLPVADSTRLERALVLFWIDDIPYVFSERGNLPSLKDHAAPPRLRTDVAAALASHDLTRSSAHIGVGLDGRQRSLLAVQPIPTLNAVLVRELDASSRASALTRSAWQEVLFFVFASSILAFAIMQRRRARISERERAHAEYRANFAALMSHEFRTPIAQIRLFADILESGTMQEPGATRRSLGIISKESRRLGLMIDNLLAFATLDQARTSRLNASVHLVTEVEHAIAAFEPIAAERGVTLALEVDGSAHTIRAAIDDHPLRQILNNLLDNALKYGPSQQTIVVRLMRDGDTALIHVDDEGPGIPAADVRKLLEPFARLESAVEAGIPGSGLGLAVVSQLAERHGAQLALDTRGGGGTRATVRLRIAPGEDTP